MDWGAECVCVNDGICLFCKHDVGTRGAEGREKSLNLNHLLVGIVGYFFVFVANNL